jgi:hypothetical protein
MILFNIFNIKTNPKITIENQFSGNIVYIKQYELKKYKTQYKLKKISKAYYVQIFKYGIFEHIVRKRISNGQMVSIPVEVHKYKLSIEFYIKFRKKISWGYAMDIPSINNETLLEHVCTSQNLTEKFVIKYMIGPGATEFIQHFIHWNTLFNNSKMGVIFFKYCLKYHTQNFNWDLMCSNPNITAKFINKLLCHPKYHKNINWKRLSQNRNIGNRFFLNNSRFNPSSNNDYWSIMAKSPNIDQKTYSKYIFSESNPEWDPTNSAIDCDIHYKYFAEYYKNSLYSVSAVRLKATQIFSNIKCSKKIINMLMDEYGDYIEVYLTCTDIPPLAKNINIDEYFMVNTFPNHKHVDTLVEDLVKYRDDFSENFIKTYIMKCPDFDKHFDGSIYDDFNINLLKGKQISKKFIIDNILPIFINNNKIRQLGDWYTILNNPNIDEPFIKKYIIPKNKKSIEYHLTSKDGVTDDMLTEEKFNWNVLLNNPNISDKFLLKYEKYIILNASTHCCYYI